MVAMRLYDKIIAKSSLSLAWDKVRANQGAPGGDRQTIDDFAENLERNLENLRESLRSGTYHPGPLRNISIPKRDGTPRPLSIPTVADRVVHTALCQGLSPILEPEMEDSSFAYRPGRSVQMAVDRIERYFRQGYRWVVDGDIDDYFDSIPHHSLLEILRRHVDDDKVLGLIAQWLEHAQPDGTGLAQGSPLSPLLANIYLDDIDERICRAGVRLVRFADDFVLLCKSPAQAREAQEEMADLLAEHGLRLHPEKTRIVSFEQGFQFLGRLFVRSLVLEHDRALDAPGEPDRPAPASGAEAAELGEEPFPVEPLHQTPEGPGFEALSPRVRVMYLTRKGCRLEVRNRAFAVRAGPEPGAGELLAVMPSRVDRIELWPGTDISAPAQRHALVCRVPVAYVDGWGRTLGTLEAVAPNKAALHLAQAALTLDAAKRLDLARRICRGRVRNQRALLNRLNRRRKDPGIENHLASLNSVLRRIATATAIPALLGLEGEAAKHYWAALTLLVDKEWGFSGRVRRPPGDPVNLVISYTASLLYRDLSCLTARHGLHPGFGSLHGALDGKPGCVSDLVEEFRAPLCEGLAIYLVNNHILSQDMFYQTEKRPCQVTSQGRETIIRSFEAWLDRPVKSPRAGEKVKWRGLMDEQVLAYRDHVWGRGPYEPYDMKY
ncbi:MAG: CRISPR-associated endonuclease Cas1 [Deltaproteobacteria bacterium]|nr:CRISPR-associated endonuclease Cas1 [Deltaproteobacteria bacterium]